MPYSVKPSEIDSNIWTIFDDRDEVVFSGLYQQCEEWLDLADLRALARGQSSRMPTDTVPIRWPVFERATALLNRLWIDCAGEVRVSGEWPAIFVMIVAAVCLSNQFVWPAVAQQTSLMQGASAVANGSQESCAGAHVEASCCNSRTLDIACDEVDD